RLQKTKRGVRIINCARGGLIDEAALVEALQDRHVAGAALDVFETEPLPVDSPLRSAPDLVLTPHLGASTAEAQESVGIEIAQSILRGFLQAAGGSDVNEVNAPAFAESLGLKVSESRLSAPGDYTDMLELSAAGEGKTVSVGGAFFGATPRIVSINGRPVEARPHGVVLVLENTDRPGMVGRIGTLLGNHGVNI